MFRRGEPSHGSPELLRGVRGETGLLNRSSEGRGVKAVRLWVVEQAAHDRVPYEWTQDLLGVEPAAGLEHSLDLAERRRHSGM